MDDRDAYIALNMMQGIGPITVRSLVEVFGSPGKIFDAKETDLLGVPGVGREIAGKILAQRDRLDPVKETKRAEEIGVRLVTPVDVEYPRSLLEIHDPPLALYVQGTLESRDKHAVAVVGSRHTTHYGMEVAGRLAYQLAQSGFTVVSGLARGIDTAAHQGALKGGGRTLAVLGGAIDRIYPAENLELARTAARQGAVISEFLLGREPDKTTFPMRNRIVSGLSMGVVVVEAGLTSGAMITAGQALDQGRAVFAVPGRIDSPASKGTHQLLKNGARLVESVEDILQEFEMLLPPTKRTAGPAGGGVNAAPATPRPKLSDQEQALVSALTAGEPMDVDALTRESGLGAAAVGSLLIMLEMKRVIRMLPGRMVELRT